MMVLVQRHVEVSAAAEAFDGSVDERVIWKRKLVLLLISLPSLLCHEP